MYQCITSSEVESMGREMIRRRNARENYFDKFESLAGEINQLTAKLVESVGLEDIGMLNTLEARRNKLEKD